MKALIHIGYPKTGTTLLQKCLFTKLHDLGLIKYLGKFYRKKEKEKFKALIYKLIYDEESPLLYKDLDELEKLRNTQKLVVLSNEDLSISYIDFTDDVVMRYADPFDTANRIKTLLGSLFDEIKILIVIRAQITMLYSYYVEGYKWKFRHIEPLNTFPKFLNMGIKRGKKGNLKMFYYYDIYKHYVNLFGKENVHILLYEDMKYSPNEFSDSINRILGIKEGYALECLKHKENVKRRSNQGYISDNIELSTEITTFVAKLLKRKAIRTLKRFIYDKNMVLRYFYRNIILSLSEKIIIKKGIIIPQPSEEEINKIFLTFRDNNLNFIRDGILDERRLKDYGYI